MLLWTVSDVRSLVTPMMMKLAVIGLGTLRRAREFIETLMKDPAALGYKQLPPVSGWKASGC